MQQVKDNLTGELFTPSRRNQKFRTAKNRIAYNNLKASKERESKAFIDKPLQANHRILMELIKSKEKKTYSKDYLSGKGFNFSVLSHYDEHEGNVYPALYNFILIDLPENKTTITIYRK